MDQAEQTESAAMHNTWAENSARKEASRDRATKSISLSKDCGTLYLQRWANKT